MSAANRGWRSPYANDTGVAERVVQIILSNLR
jgi:hypothetical protein